MRAISARARLPVLAALALVLALFLALFPALLPGPAHAQGLIRGTLHDYDVVNGYFFTETGGDNGEHGYSITDEDGVPLWQEYQRLGGPDALGYPISRRFLWDGFVVQATQKAVLQWHPELGRAVTVNLLDELTRAGKDDWLFSFRQIPRPAAFADEAGLTAQQVTDKRLRLLDASPALRAAYLETPDFLEANGLPVAPVTDIGPALVLRAQRRAFQQWKVATPFARPGQVTVVNGGDLGKEAELYPAAATEPEPSAAQLAVQPGSNVRLPGPEVAVWRQTVERARPAVVRLTDGDTGVGSGILFDPSGLILTNSHVVTALNPERTVAILPDGRRFPARQLGADEFTDVALVKIEGTGLPSVPLGSAAALQIGERVIGIGNAPILPGSPSAKLGTVRSLSGQIQTFQDYPLSNLITTDTFLHPGDSGGPLLNARGEVVGLNSAIRIGRRGAELSGYSIPVEGARAIADQILTTGRVPRPHIGVSIQEVTPALAGSLGLPVPRGVLITQVQEGGPAEAAGIQPGDVIVGMDGRDVVGITDLRRLMVDRMAGDRVSLALTGNNRPRHTVVVTLAERPPSA
jgi:serine protease Do